MNRLLWRVVLALLAGAVGALLGAAFGSSLQAPLAGAAAGAALLAALSALPDAIAGRRLMRWLRGSLDAPAPRNRGFWGEAGYRVEKALRQRERALAAEHERLAQFLSAIEASPNGMLLLDRDDRITWCSRVAAEHLRLDAQRDRLQRLTNLVRDPAFVAFLQQPEAADEALRFAAPGGDALSVRLRRYGDEGRRLLLTQDVSERERQDAMRRDFVANVSHEIRTPLTVLAGSIESMATLSLSDAERTRMLALMQQQSQRMQMLVADLLALAELEGSPRPTLHRWVAVDALLERALTDARALSAGRHEIVLAAGAPTELAGDGKELLSAVGNLLTNAVRYTPAGGRIDIGWTVRDDGSVAIAVSDTGIGIAREHLPRLAERFYRIDGSRSRESGGTGLGLSIVKHVVQRHGGEMRVDSEPGRGSTFMLRFPAQRVRAAAPTASR